MIAKKVSTRLDDFNIFSKITCDKSHSMTNKLTETKMMAIEINSNFQNNIENNPSTKIFATILPTFR